MNDKTFRIQKARLEKLLKKWRAALGLYSWSITYEYFRGPWQQSGEESYILCIAEAFPDYRYQQASIKWNIEETEKLDDATLEKCVVHEFVHLITDMFKRYATHDNREGTQIAMPMSEVELQTTILTQSIIWAYKDGIQTGKKVARNG